MSLFPPEAYFYSDPPSYQRVKATSPFLVFADSPGYRAPTFKHPSRPAAEAEARRLAQLNPGVNYYVLGSLSLTAAAKPTAKTRSLV